MAETQMLSNAAPRVVARRILTSSTACDLQDPRITKVVAFVERNLRHNIHLSDAARVAALEKHYFAVLFRKSIGMTFTRFVRERRVHHAMHLLERSSSSIASIAWAVGYRDCTGLARAFREVRGMSPRKARQLLCSASARVG